MRTGIQLIGGNDAALAPALQQQLDQLLRLIFAGAGLDAEQPATHRSLLLVEGQVVASAAYRQRRWHTPAGPLEGALVAYVCSHPHFRGQGYAAQALEHCMQALAAAAHVPALLHCAEDLRPWYQRYGWQLLCRGAWYDEDQGPQRLDPDPVLWWSPSAPAPAWPNPATPFPLGSDW